MVGIQPGGVGCSCRRLASCDAELMLLAVVSHTVKVIYKLQKLVKAGDATVNPTAKYNTVHHVLV